MTRLQFALGFSCILGVIAIAGIIAVVRINSHEKQAEINRQIAIEQTKIEAAANLERTRERMNAIPWYKGGQNKKAPK
jgi:hypothetical protein